MMVEEEIFMKLLSLIRDAKPSPMRDRIYNVLLFGLLRRMNWESRQKKLTEQERAPSHKLLAPKHAPRWIHDTDVVDISPQDLKELSLAKGIGPKSMAWLLNCINEHLEC